MIIKYVGAGEGKCPLQHMVHCTRFVWGLTVHIHASTIATSCIKHFLEHHLPFPFLSIYVTGGADSKNAQKHVSKHAGRFSKYVLAVQTPTFAGQNSTRMFRWVRGNRFCTSSREARFLDENAFSDFKSKGWSKG